MPYLAFALALLIAFLIVAGWRESQYIIQRHQPDKPDSPARYGLPFEEVEFKSRDGITLRGWFIPAPQAKGTVIFCHGHAGSMDPDLKYVPWFHSSGFNILMFDFRGLTTVGDFIIIYSSQDGVVDSESKAGFSL